MVPLWQRKLLELTTETVPGCVLCDGVSGVVDEKWASYLSLPGTFGVLRCPNCNLHWLSPRPNSQAYEILYSNAMYFGGEGAAPAVYERVVADRVEYFRRRIRKISAIMNRSPLSILDYGAATGEFVKIARIEGLRCEGVELSIDAREDALARYGLALMSHEEALALEPAQFDVIHMNHVLEHMPDPLDHLLWCRQLLKPNGLLVLEVPQQFDNDLDRVRRWLGQGGRQKRLDAYSLHHTYFFTPATLQALLVRAGFQCLRISTFNPDKTPLWPPQPKQWILRLWLGLSDRIHKGGNIVEAFATVES